VPPRSLPDALRQELRLALQSYASAYRSAVRADKIRLALLEHEAGLGGKRLNVLEEEAKARAEENRFDLLANSAAERLGGVEARLGALQGGGASAGPAASQARPAVTGDAATDAVLYVERVADLVAAAETVRKENTAISEGSASFGERSIALRRILASDLQTCSMLGKMTPPSSLPATMQQQMRVAVQNLADAYRYSSEAYRTMIRSLESAMGPGRQKTFRPSAGKSALARADLLRVTGLEKLRRALQLSAR